jgi:hypothetical protein
MAYDMLGRSKYGVQGKTVRGQPNQVITESNRALQAVSSQICLD